MIDVLGLVLTYSFSSCEKNKFLSLFFQFIKINLLFLAQDWRFFCASSREREHFSMGEMRWLKNFLIQLFHCIVLAFWFSCESKWNHFCAIEYYCKNHDNHSRVVTIHFYGFIFSFPYRNSINCIHMSVTATEFFKLTSALAAAC